MQRPGIGLREGSLPGVPLLRFVPPSSFPLKASHAHADHSPGFLRNCHYGPSSALDTKENLKHDRYAAGPCGVHSPAGEQANTWMLAGKERVVVRLGTGQPCCWCAQDSEGPEKMRRAEQTLVQRAGLSLLPVTLSRRGWAQAVSTHGNCRVSAVQVPGGGRHPAVEEGCQEP